MHDPIRLIVDAVEKRSSVLNVGLVVSAILTKPYLDLVQQGVPHEEALDRVQKAFAFLASDWAHIAEKGTLPPQPKKRQ